MNILFQDGYFSDEYQVWKDAGANIFQGLLPEKYSFEFSPVVSRGTFAFQASVRSALKYQGWPEIVWPFENDWKCYGYSFLYDNFISEILNLDACLYYGHSRDYELILSKLELLGELWIKSNSPYKTFSGGIFNSDTFKAEVDFLRSQSPQIVQLVTASPKKIGREWRFVIVADAIISSSQYMNKGEEDIRPYDETPQDIIEYVQLWIKRSCKILPNSYVVDVCEYQNDIKVVELNHLLTSGWYKCDIKEIVNCIISVIKQY